MVFIGKESSKRRVNTYISKYISMAYFIMFLWVPGLDGTRSKVTGNFLINALHTFHRFNRRYDVKTFIFRLVHGCYFARSGDSWHLEVLNKGLYILYIHLYILYI